MNATETRLAEQLAALTTSHRGRALCGHWPPRPRKNNGRMWIIWPGSLTAKPSAGRNWPSSAALPPPASPASKPSTSLTGTGPRKSIAPRCRTSSAWPFLPDKANVVFMGGVGLGKSHLASALGHAACLADIPCSSPRPWTSSTPSPRPKPPAGSKPNSSVPAGPADLMRR